MLEVLADTGHSEFVIDRVRAAIDADPRVAGRLALWARRLVGEALGQAQRVAAEREPLARLLADGSPPARRHRPDVRRAHRRPRGPDGRARPVQLAHPWLAQPWLAQALVRARKAAVLTRFWQVVEQKRRVPLREVST